jgi:putative acetyltransferase
VPEQTDFELPKELSAKGFFLRLAKPDDSEPVKALMRDYFKELDLNLDPKVLDKDLVEPLKGYDSGGLILLIHQGSPAGCVGVRRLQDGVAEIKRMYLHPEQRGRGQGRVMLEAALALARQCGFKRLMLDTRRDLKSANRLYESYGFKDTADYNQNPRAERFMVLELG